MPERSSRSATTGTRASRRRWRSGLGRARGRLSASSTPTCRTRPKRSSRSTGELAQPGPTRAGHPLEHRSAAATRRYISPRGLNLLLNSRLPHLGAGTTSRGFVHRRRSEILADVLHLPGPIPVLPDVHHRRGEGEGLHHPRGGDAVPEPAARARRSSRACRCRSRLSALVDLPRALAEFGASAHKPRRRCPSGREDAGRTSRSTTPYRGWRKALVRAYFATMPLHAWKIGRRTRVYYYELQAVRVAHARRSCASCRCGKLQRLVQHAYSTSPTTADAMRPTGPAPARHHTASRTCAGCRCSTRTTCGENLYFDLFADNHDKREMHRISTSGSTGEPFVTLRRPAPARDPLRGDAAQPGVDGLALRRPAGAPLAPDDRHEPAPGAARAHRRLVHAADSSSPPSR